MEQNEACNALIQSIKIALHEVELIEAGVIEPITLEQLFSNL